MFLVGAICLSAATSAGFWASRLDWNRSPTARSLADALRSEDVNARLGAAYRLGGASPMEASAAVPALVGALKDKDERVSVTACKSLAGIAAAILRAGPDGGLARSSIDGLLVALTDGRAPVRIAAADSLSDLVAATSVQKTLPPLGSADPRVVMTALDQALADPSEPVRMAAARSLGYFGESGPPAPPRLIEAMEHDEAGQVRLMAMISIGRFRNGLDNAVLALIRMATSKNKPERAAASTALAGLQRDESVTLTMAVAPVLIAGLDSPDRMVQVHSAGMLGKYGPEAKDAVPGLLKRLREPAGLSNADPAVPAARALARITPGTSQADEVLSTFLAIMKGSEPSRRKGVVTEELARFDRAKLEPIIPFLVESLKPGADKTGPPRLSVLLALGRIAPGTPKADQSIAVLTTVLDDSSPQLRSAAARGLGGFGPKARSALAKLDEMIENDKNFRVKTDAFEAAEKIDESPEAKTSRVRPRPPLAVP